MAHPERVSIIRFIDKVTSNDKVRSNAANYHIILGILDMIYIYSVWTSSLKKCWHSTRKQRWRPILTPEIVYVRDCRFANKDGSTGISLRMLISSSRRHGHRITNSCNFIFDDFDDSLNLRIWSVASSRDRDVNWESISSSISSLRRLGSSANRNSPCLNL